jgi:hypothetical protein
MVLTSAYFHCIKVEITVNVWDVSGFQISMLRIGIFDKFCCYWKNIACMKGLIIFSTDFLLKSLLVKYEEASL